MFTKIYVKDQVGATVVAARRNTRNKSLCEDTGKCTTNTL